MKLVSVVIPCYRDSATLGRAIRSVLAQTYRPIEVVVVNDCSPETGEIEGCLAEFPEVRYLRNERNLGLAATRNAGLVAATGDCVAFLDADDEYHPRKIEYQMASLIDENLIVTCAIEMVAFGRATLEPARCGVLPVNSVSGVGRMLFRNRLIGAAILAPRALLLKLGGYDPALRSCEDYDLWLRIFEAGVPVRKIEGPLYRYYFNPVGLSKNHLEISRWELEAVSRHFRRCNRADGKSFLRETVYLSWLFKHLCRADRFGIAELRNKTMENRRHILKSRVSRTALLGLDFLRLPWLIGKVMNSISKRSQSKPKSTPDWVS